MRTSFFFQFMHSLIVHFEFVWFEKLLWAFVTSKLPDKVMSVLSMHYQILLCFEISSIHRSKMVSHQDVGQQHVMSDHFCHKHFLKYKPHKADVAPIYLLIKYSHLCGSKYFSRCHNLKFALDYLHFEVNFYILKPFGYSSKRRRQNGATAFGPCYLS